MNSRHCFQGDALAITTKLGRLIASIGLIAWTAVSAVAADAPKDQPWTPLFNGRNLDGWYTYLNGAGKNSDPDQVFQVHDGVIHVYKDQADGKATTKGYFATDASYSYYRLRFQYKWGTKQFPPRYKRQRDSGLIYHVTAPDFVWPRCLECQVQEEDVGDCFAVNGARLEVAVDPQPVLKDQYRCRSVEQGGVIKTLGGKRTTRFIKEGMYEVDGWNSVEVIVRGDEETEHIVNGHTVFRGQKLGKLGVDNRTWESLSAGRIAFQAEFAEVMYRNIEIQPIQDGPLHPQATE